MVKLIFIANRENMTDAVSLAENAPQVIDKYEKDHLKPSPLSVDDPSIS